MAELRESGLDLIREYIPDSPAYTPGEEEEEYTPTSNNYYRPPTPVYTPSTITAAPDSVEDTEHIVFTEPPASPTPSGDVSMDVTSTSSGNQLHASVHPTSDADIIMHPELMPSEPAQGMPIPVHISHHVPGPMTSEDKGEEKEEGSAALKMKRRCQH